MSKLTQQLKLRYVRIAIPLLLITVWLALAGFGGPLFGRISEVASNDQSTFLPSSAESTIVSKELTKFQDDTTIPAIIVFSRDGEPIRDTDKKQIAKATAALSDLSDSGGPTSPPIVSDDKLAAIVVANMDSEAEYKDYVKNIKTALGESNLSVSYAITGPVGFLSDIGEAFSGIDGLLLIVALSVVFVILIIVYRSPILPFVVLTTSLFALCAALLVVFYLARSDILTLNGQVQGILFILVIGAATDYSLLYVARYQEELKRHRKVYEAIITSWKRSIEPIAAAGGTVTAGLLCLLLSDLGSNKALGPVGAIGIIMAVLSALTLLPSLLALLGRKVFWPKIPYYGNKISSKNTSTNGRLWPAVADFVASRSRSIWIVTTVALIIGSLGLFQLKADGVPQSEFVIGASEARDGQKLLDKHFPGGSGTPAYIKVPSSLVERAAESIENDRGVDSVTARAVNSPSGTIPFGDAAKAPIFKNASVKIVDSEALLEVTLTDTSDSTAAQATIERLRSSLHKLDSKIAIGGTAAVQLDTRIAADHDRAVVIPTVLVIITVILMLLLRSILAPILLLLTTVLSFAATLGISAVIFNNLFNFPGADATVVLYGFIFLVALGIDYNIFLMTRVREESVKKGTSKGILAGLIATGGVITSAGIVLAATFAALGVIPILFLIQLAFIVALGVLLDTVVVRSLLVPALTRDIGGAIWWPSKNRK
jgi:RND superfamily putative drug exporter